MEKDDLIRCIERFRSYHDRRQLREYSTERLAEYLDYLERMHAPLRCGRRAHQEATTAG